MAVRLEPTPVKAEDTVANHGIQTSGNAVFLSMRLVKTPQKPEDITDMATDIRKLDSKTISIGVKPLYKTIAHATISGGMIRVEPEGPPESTLDIQPDVFYPVTMATPPYGLAPPSIGTDIRVLIDQETDKLKVLSDSIGPALLSVINTHGPLTRSEMSESLDIATNVLNSRLEVLHTTNLVMLDDGEYSISEEGIEFLRSLDLEEESP